MPAMIFDARELIIKSFNFRFIIVLTISKHLELHCCHGFNILLSLSILEFSNNIYVINETNYNQFSLGRRFALLQSLVLAHSMPSQSVVVCFHPSTSVVCSVRVIRCSSVSCSRHADQISPDI
jgi:hypothetical protein